MLVYAKKWKKFLKKIKHVSRIWTHDWNRKHISLLMEVEGRHAYVLILRPTKSLLEEEIELGNFLRKKLELLALEDSKWRLKSGAIWLKEADNNSKFFHIYENHRRKLNLISKIINSEG